MNLGINRPSLLQNGREQAFAAQDKNKKGIVIVNKLYEEITFLDSDAPQRIVCDFGKLDKNNEETGKQTSLIFLNKEEKSAGKSFGLYMQIKSKFTHDTSINKEDAIYYFENERVIVAIMKSNTEVIESSLGGLVNHWMLDNKGNWKSHVYSKPNNR